MTLPLDVQLLKIGLQFVTTRAKGDWKSAEKLIKCGSFDTKGGCICSIEMNLFSFIEIVL